MTASEQKLSSPETTSQAENRQEDGISPARGSAAGCPQTWAIPHVDGSVGHGFSHGGELPSPSTGRSRCPGLRWLVETLTNPGPGRPIRRHDHERLPGALRLPERGSLVTVPGPSVVTPACLLSPLRAVADLLVKSWAVMLVQLGAAAVVFARQKTGRSAAVSVPSHDGRDLLYHHVQQCGNGFPRAPRARPACFTADDGNRRVKLDGKPRVRFSVRSPAAGSGSSNISGYKPSRRWGVPPKVGGMTGLRCLCRTRRRP